MIRYSQIENLPPNHPLVLQFEKELKDEDAMYEAMGPMTSNIHDEGSMEHFERFVAGDRK
jgi:hypothetical protein